MRSYTFETQKKAFFDARPSAVKKTPSSGTLEESVTRTPILLVKTRIPVFSPMDGEAAAHTTVPTSTEKAFCEKINRWYAANASRYIQVPSKILKKAAGVAQKGGKPCSFVWHTEVPLNGKTHVSLFTDVSGFDTQKTVKRRFCTLWSAEQGLLLSPKQVFHTDAKSRKIVIDHLCRMAENQLNRKLFTYYDNFEAILHKHFSFGSFYFVPNGVAFCFDGGRLNARSEEIAVFVVPFESLEGILKFVPEREIGKTEQL